MTQPFHVQKDVLLSRYSTFGIGGKARGFIEVNDIETLQAVLAACAQDNIPYFILGKGSNCLFDDQGIDAWVIRNRISFLETEGNLWRVGAGYSFSRLGLQSVKAGWAGLEFATGIPASVGGAVYMNAGANGQETKDHLHSVEWLSPDGTLHITPREEIDFAYRFSSFHTHHGVIVAATFALTPSSEAKERQEKILNYRMETQPYGLPSVGCIFRNPTDNSAGALIDSCGLKGQRVGGAEVSEQHANFIVNMDQASTKDVQELIKKVQQEVKKQTGYDLETEVRYIPKEWPHDL